MKRIIDTVKWIIIFPFALVYLAWELLQDYWMHKAQVDYEQSDFYKSLNHNPNVPCSVCGRYPEVYEDAFPHKICESCYEIWLDEIWEEKYGNK